MDNLISKKQLLVETGISYGQLYRWKRKGLIPDAWFVRQSTFTGQETFFPRDEILDRIRWIQGMKDDASLDELASQVAAPGSWQERIPVSLVSAHITDTDAICEESTISLGELFVHQAAQAAARRARLSPADMRQAKADLSHLPPTWLDYPAAVLIGFSLSDNSLCFIAAQSPDAVWLPRAAAVTVSLGDVFKETKNLWERAVASANRGFRKEHGYE
jgi:hypothetical protein